VRRTPATLLDVLRDAATEAPGQVIVHVRADGTEHRVSHEQLWDEALRVAGGYLDAGLRPGVAVPVLADRSDDFLALFWGALAAGLVPVPLAPHAARVQPVWEQLGHPVVAVDAATAGLLGDLPGGVVAVHLDDLRRAAPVREVSVPSEVAFLQFSSGSTGAPRGVELTHANVLACLDQATTAAAMSADDVVLSWMPYFHDMGLIGTHLMPLAARSRQVKMGPLAFAKRPVTWFQLADRHRATVLSAANFALALTARRVPDEALAELDLSNVRLVGVGAEPISPAVWREFARRTALAGLDPRALQPVYGLAEATLGVTCPPLGEIAVPVRIDRAALSAGRADDAAPGADVTELMDVGHPVPGLAVRIVDDTGAVAADRRVGHIEVRGPNVARRYHGAPEASAATFVDGWLRTGDLGFLRDGRLCVTGRHKDVVFVNGRTFHASDLEDVAAATPGLPAGLVAVVGSTDPGYGGERVAVFVQWTRRRDAAADEVLDRVATRVRTALGHDDVRVLPLPRGGFPRTTSGKLRRAELRARFEAGAYGPAEARAPRPPVSAGAPPTGRDAAELVVRDIWAGVLSLAPEAIGPHDRFMALGGSSLKAMEVLAGLEDAFGRTIRPAALQDCDTVAALADHLLGASPVVRRDRRLPPGDRPVVAVLAMACRFPGADTPEQFWSQLVAGHDAVTTVPPDRWATTPGAGAHWGAFLDDPAGFDAGFFGMTDDEARATDPQARIFLELAHEALERAGHAGPRRTGRRIGIFAAVGESGYPELLAGSGPSASVLVGNLRNLVAARVAQCLDLTGPALAVDTACSSALVALHLARQSIESGECDLAVVGGVNLNLTSTGYRLLDAAQALSPTGRCHAFGAAADGFVPGEGGAAVVLGRWDDARDGGDPVLALLRGTAVNNDGRSLSLMAPNPLLQREVIVQAYRDAGVDPATVSYVEAHGTGTAVGDPIEVRSLAHAFPALPGGRLRALGSVKTNVGHLLNAAGMPALVKVLLALQHRTLPPTLHHAPPATGLDLPGAGLRLVTETTGWTSDGPLIAGVNAFGFGGTNAHAVLEQAPPAQPPVTGRATGPHLLTLSARSADALSVAAADLAAHLREHPDLAEADVCATVGAARDDGPHRLAVVADGDLERQLAAGVPGGVTHRRRPRLVFLLPGQGVQRPGQARDLYGAAPEFRRVLDEASDLVGPVHGRSLAGWCLDPDAPAEALARTEVTQPLLVAYGVALARQLRHWGITPDAVTGHSIGEITAACCAGTLSLADAVGFAAARGRLMQSLAAPGAMAAVAGDEDTVADLVHRAAGRLTVAAVNGPRQLVLAGAADTVDEAVTALASRGVRARRLEVSHAFHSPMMRPALGPLAEAAAALRPVPSDVPLMSTVTAGWNPVFGPDHLSAHAVRPVLFGAAVERLRREGFDTFAELGPGATLAALVQAQARPGDDTITVSAAVDGRSLMDVAGRLWVRGVTLDRTAMDAGRARVPVPTYPFRRRRHWAGAAPLLHVPTATDTAPFLHVATWTDAAVTGHGGGPGVVWLPGPVTAFADALAKRLTRDGATVYRGDGVPPAPDTVVLVCGPSADLDDVAGLDAIRDTAVTAIQHLIVALGERRPLLLVVTEDVQPTGEPTDRLRPAHALVGGLAMALPEELPGLVLRTVDVSSSDGPQARLDALAQEVGAGRQIGADSGIRAGREIRAVAWRAGRRLARTLTPAPVAAAAALPGTGVYLITGGAGGVGGALARQLAHDLTAPVLVLTGRSATAPDGLLAALTAAGADARYVRADVASDVDVDALIGGLDRIDGVFHAVGVIRPGTLRAKTPREIAEVLAPKVRGTVLLARALWEHGHHDVPCTVISSIASVVPGFAGALGDYAAANAFLDAFAAAQRAAGRPWQAVGFAAFAEVGRAAAPGVQAAIAARGIPALRTADALRALHAARGLPAAHLVVADLSDQGVRAAVPPADVEPADVAATVTVDPAQDVAGLLRRLLAGPLHRDADEIGDDEPFLAMGLDSLTAVDLVKHLERDLGTRLPATLLFEHRTIGELTAHLTGARPAMPAPPLPQAGAGPEAAVGPKAEVGPVPLTAVQRAFHTLGRLHPDVAAYGYVRQVITGPLDPALLGAALAHLGARHPMLRLRITPGPQQHSAPPADGAPTWFAVTDLHGPIEDLEESLCNRVFDLATEGPLRAVLARDGERAHLILVAHHAAVDGFSLHLLGRQLWTVYTDLSAGRDPAPAPEAATFGAYAAADLSRPADAAYWQEVLRGHKPMTLPYDGDADGPPAPPLVTRQADLDGTVTAALRERAAAAGVSLFHLLLAAYARCLAEWSGQPDIAINVARSRREVRVAGVDELVGPLADTLPVLVTVDTDDPVALAVRLREAWLDAERHAGVSSLDLARLLPVAGSGPRTVSPASFSFARFPAAGHPGCPVTASAVAAGTASAATRLSLLCWQADGRLHFSWTVPARLFHRDTVDGFAARHLAELTAIASSPHRVADPGIVARIAAQICRTPDAVAVDTGDTAVTYAELDRAATAVAARLQAAGVSPGDRVGLLTGPGRATVAGVVGILRAGAAWVPLDADHPPARLGEQVRRCDARVLVHDASTAARARGLTDAVLVAADDTSPHGPATAVDADPDRLAYVIFTSGSTGRPKAVPITHRAIESYLDWALSTFGYRPGDRLAQTASICFDASVRQLLAPLLCGATVMTFPRDLLRDPDALLGYLERARITVWSSVPTLWEQLLAAAQRRTRAPDLSAVRWLHVGGEALAADPVRRWYALFGPGHRIANLYGPTESTINATYHLLDGPPDDGARQVPIGRPVAGTDVEVVGTDGTACAPGQAGELLIAGVGLTPGYLGDPVLTEAAFTVRGGRRWYRSGDRVRRGPDGVLHFLGRLDDQVKVRGHRVEPGEVEGVLRTHPAVTGAVVLAVDDPPRLVAYVVTADAGAPTAAELRAHLAGLLPAYLVPARIHLIDALPLTGTGKVDRARLLQTRPESGPAPGSAPATATERMLAEIWCTLLDVPAVSRDDDFFALGGDSIAVLEVFARLQGRVPALPRPTVIYRQGTLAALAAVIDATPAVEPTAPVAAPADPFPLSASQRGFLLAEAVAPGRSSAWLATLRIRGPLDPDRFQRAVDVLVARHPMLRTVFPSGARPPVQQELPATLRLPVDHEVLTAPDPATTRTALAARIDDERRHRFEPWAWPLLRLRLLTIAAHEHVLVVHGHHLIGDGWSAHLLSRELLAAYDDAGCLPPLTATFRDHVTATVPDRAGAVRPAAPYEPPVLRARPWDASEAVLRSAAVTLDTGQVGALRLLAAQAGGTLHAPVLTAYHRALVALTGRDTLVLGFAVSGRDDRAGVTRVFGPFATAVPLRLGPVSDSFRKDLAAVVAEVATARAHGTEQDNTQGVRHPNGLPPTAQFFFTFLDFAALGAPISDTLELSWDDADAEFAPPPVGTDVFVAVRPTGTGLTVTVRAAAAALDAAAFDRFTTSLRTELTDAAASEKSTLDAALVGYLPAPAQLAALAGLDPAALPRETVRALVFPDGGPRLLEEVATPLGRSGFVCLPVFADELAEGADLSAQTSRAVLFAASRGARSVSLAGMIPALTGYGFDVLRDDTFRRAPAPPVLTTGHAVTAVSVVTTVHAALEATGRDLGALTVAVVGLGSIGRTSLELLLRRAARPPARLLLCDVTGSGPRLAALAAELSGSGLAGDVQWCEACPTAPDAVHRAGLIVAAVSGGATVLDVDRLRAGAIVVDDSFPHCLDTARAVARMRDRGDVLVVGGGLLDCGRTERWIAEGLPAAASGAGALRPPGTMASCQLESVLLAATAGLPPVHGLVEPRHVEAYWAAVQASGVRAAPLHLVDHQVDAAMLAAFPANHL
jgi:amino acid adenylation domain-containing protein